MSKLKFSANLFLEVNELQRFHKFLADDGWKRMMRLVTKRFGIIENDNNSFFKVTKRSNSNSTIVINAGIAFNSNLDAIVLSNALEMTVANTGTPRWIILSRGVTNEEQGTVSIKSDGSLSGVNTEFTKVLRGQPNFPTKVKFNSTKNSEEYEVVSVISDTSALLSGSFVDQSEMKYSVIGTFTPGFQPAEDDKLIYEYDSYNINIIDSTSKPNVSDDEYILAMINYDGTGAMNIIDERINYMFNNPYAQSDTTIDEFINPLTNLLKAKIIGGTAVNSVATELELIMEHGYIVTKHELTVTSTTNVFNILAGQSNYFGTNSIPDGTFAGWLLVNRNNMKSAIIDDNTNKSLYISSLDTSIISDDNDFIIVPNCNEIEYEIIVSNNVNSPSIPFFVKNSIVNPYTRARIYVYYPINTSDNDKVTIQIKYRLITDDGKRYPFKALAITQFDNINDQKETLSNGSFDINIADVKPEAKQRNYS